jgi:hypothetical protein
MHEKAVHILEALRKKWILHTWTSYGILSAAIGLVAGELLHRLFGFSYLWMIPLTILSFICFLILKISWRISTRDIARFLDANYPTMEESATLLLLDPADSGSLLQMQIERTSEAIRLEYPKINFPPKIKRALQIWAIAGIICLTGEGFFYLFPSGKMISSKKITPVENPVHPLPSIHFMRIRISPPAYTRVPSREQEQADIFAEEGSGMDWEIKTDQPVKNLGFLFNDSVKIFLQPKNPEHTEWAFHRILQAPGFYQMIIDSQVSEHYKMEMIRDLFPEIEVESPKPKTILEYGMALQIPLRVSIRDDYGIRSAAMYATISSGSGEAVKFTEKQISFNESFQLKNTQYTLQKLIDLNHLGMVPGDELYFYIRATDNHSQEKKSGIFIVSLADTADLMSTELAVSGLNVKPEYFRSERQIILETQQLLANRHTMRVEVFNNKSSDLGIDQKMLRLRYGKFLGEEEESNELGSDKPNDLNNPSNFGNAATVLDAYTDKHDNAADASFFEKDTKDQLKATLTEMWNAELQLRTFKPEAALPYEYKALRLLKDLQQKSRVFVAKTGYKTTPLDFGKRLTGEQSKIMNPVEAWATPDNTGTFTILREALGILQTIKSNSKPEARSMEILQEAGGQLREKAIQEPSKYLASYVAFRQLLILIKKESGLDGTDLQIVEKALQELVKPLAEIPYKLAGTGNGDLSDYYFRNLKKPQ